MARQYTTEVRRKIINDFAARHGGQYLPAAFLAEVKRAGKKHPAYGWFTWDPKKAALEHQLWQAREFANGIIVKFQVEELHRGGRITVREREMPFVLSPLASRNNGGGYYIVDPNDHEHMLELCRQGASALETWCRRYSSALSHAGGSIQAIERQLKILEASFEEGVREAAE